MKSYTDIEQSKKLAEILLLESADMYYLYDEHMEMYDDYPRLITDTDELWGNDIPCWSLAALLDLIPDIIEEYVLRIDKVDGEYFIWYDKIGEGWSDVIDHPSSENFIDAAFEMVCWLKENKKI